MKPTNNKALSCSVFGHNYVKSKTNSDETIELQCSQCHIITTTDKYGNFIESTISNKNIQSALRKLFHLNYQISKPA